MNSRDKRIALDIIKAQVASDGGKRIGTPYDEESMWRTFYGVYYDGYSVKDHYIEGAIRKIQSYKNSSFKFNVRRAMDQNGYPSYIVYFNYKLDGERKQISFHSPSRNCSVYEKYCSRCRNNMITWDHKSSQQNAIDLFEMICKK